MLASPGMLQNGVSRALLERWAPDAKNGVVITGYSVEGTMAKQIVLEPDSIPAVMSGNNQRGGGAGMLKKPNASAGSEEKTMIPRRLTVQEFSFAAHVDGQENREFIEGVDAAVVILVHGEKHNMNRLKSRLLGLQRFKVYSPANCEEVRIPFRRDKVARVVGRLASEVQPPQIGEGLPSPPKSDEDDGGEDVKDVKKRKESEGTMMSGVLVQNDFKLSFMAPEDLKEYAGLTTTTIRCRQRITLAAAGVELIRWALEGTFGTITTIADPSTPATSKADTNGNGKHEEADEEISREESTVFEVMGGAVRLTCHGESSGGEVELEWEGNRNNDSIADAVMAVLLTIESSPAAVKKSSQMHAHHHHDDHVAAEKDGYDGFGGSSTEEKAAGQNGFDVAIRDSTAARRPFATHNPQEKLSRIFMFLEAQFGEDAVTPIQEPRLSASIITASDEDEDIVAKEKAIATELARLHDLGIPVPGVEIKVDKMVAKVWLEGLEVECGNKSFGDRVRAVVEGAVGVVSPLWG